MSCDFCGLDFDVTNSREGCAACSVWGGGGCKYVKCPRCGYEMPELPDLPGWVQRIKSFLSNPSTPQETEHERPAPGHAP
ncbi:MAG: hypothetical protein P1V51_06800 [Deltaproteobacteria bacterium]|nr:hypothetical protein [Deltaproteobacteria bacterium]